METTYALKVISLEYVWYALMAEIIELTCVAL